MGNDALVSVLLIGTLAVAFATNPDDNSFREYIDTSLHKQGSSWIERKFVSNVSTLAYPRQDYKFFSLVRVQETDVVYVGAFGQWLGISFKPFFVINGLVLGGVFLWRLYVDISHAIEVGETPRDYLSMLVAVVVWIFAQVRANMCVEQALAKTLWMLRLVTAIQLGINPELQQVVLPAYVAVVLVLLAVLRLPEYEPAADNHLIELTNIDFVQENLLYNTAAGTGGKQASKTAKADERDGVNWAVVVHASKTASSLYVSSLFASLAHRYRKEKSHVRLARLDATMYPNIARLLGVSSKTALPAFVVLSSGKAIRRSPETDSEETSTLMTSRKALIKWINLDDLFLDGQKKSAELANSSH